MSKAIVGMIPFAIGLVGIGVAIWWSLSREMALGRWLLGGFLVAPGLVHLLFFVPAPAQATGGAEWPFDLSRSWLVTGAGLDDGAVRLVGMALVVVVAAGFLLSGLATVGVLVPSGWWPVLVAASSVASALTLALFFDPQLVLGLGIDALLVWVVLASVWTPVAAVSS